MSYKVPYKKIIKSVSILVLIIATLLIHDLFSVTFSDLSSKELFFPTLFENDCFHQIFEKDVVNEQIISFRCHTEFWTSGWYYEIALFCDVQCFYRLFGFDYQILDKTTVREVNKESWINFVEDNFVKNLEEYYGRKKESLTEVVIYHYFDDEDHSGEAI